MEFKTTSRRLEGIVPKENKNVFSLYEAMLPQDDDLSEALKKLSEQELITVITKYKITEKMPYEITKESLIDIIVKRTSSDLKQKILTEL